MADPGRFVLSTMTRADVPEVMLIERLCFVDPWDRIAFERETVNSFSRPLVARDADGRMAGYIIYWVAGPEFHVLNVAVHPDYRRRGLGRVLMDRCIGEARTSRAEFVTLEVRRSNLAAKGLYRSYGFVTVGVRRRYYKDGEDAEVMVMDLAA